MCVHLALQRAAHAHSQEMLDRDYFSHDSANGDRFWVRLERFGYNWRTAGENILYDPGSPDSTQSVFKVWMKSPDHKSNILNGRFREVSVGARSANYEGSKATCGPSTSGLGKSASAGPGAGCYRTPPISGSAETPAP